jgi:8-oxo-dGTP diphosphatase
MAHRTGKPKPPWPSDSLVVSLSLNAVLVTVLLYLYAAKSPAHSLDSLIQKDVTFHGGHPSNKKHGTCYCSKEDSYCMCNPSLAIDLVILSGKDHLWLVRRKDTQQLATMGGFVDVGESVQEAVARELQEEMGLVLKKPPVLFGVYSDPRRDNRRHTVGVVFAIHLDGSEMPSPSDDVKEVKRIALTDIYEMSSKDLFADHLTIVKDYLNLLNGKKSTSEFVSSAGDFAPDIQRAICIPLDP